MKNILVNIEFNEHTTTQVNYAVELACRFHENLILLVNSDSNEPPSIISDGMTLSKQEEKRKKELDLIQNIVYHYNEFKGKIHTVMTRGNNIKCVNYIVKKWNIDLVVFNPTLSILDYQYALPNARLASKKDLSGLCIPPHVQTSHCWENLLYVSGTSTKDISNIEWLVQLARKSRAKIEVLTIAKQRNLIHSIKLKNFIQKVNKSVSYENLYIRKSPIYLPERHFNDTRYANLLADTVALNYSEKNILKSLNMNFINKLIQHPNKTVLAL